MSEVLRLGRFCLVGALGFILDAGATVALTHAMDWSPGLARVLAFTLAASATWFLNRSFTFRSAATAKTWLPYVLLTAAGAVLNIAIYMAWLYVAGTQPLQILIGIALGSAAALTLNYGIARRYVFSA